MELEIYKYDHYSQMLPLMNDKDLALVLSAFRKLGTISLIQRNSDNWEDYDFDIPKYMLLTGYNQQLIIELLERLKGWDLIYPDGSISKNGEAYLADFVNRRIKPPKKKE
jgi:hypothetical protein